MSLRVLDPEREVQERLRLAVEKALPGARVEVASAMPGHFELRVVAEQFRDRSRLEQHQTVYAAIAPLMQGEGAPVHAIDRLQTEAP